MQPLGNLLYEEGGYYAGIAARSRALGTFHVLSDDLLCRLMQRLHPRELAVFAQLSSACRAFAIDEDLWRRAALQRFGAAALVAFAHSWRATYASLHSGTPPPTSHTPALHASAPVLAPFYSDVLFHKWRCLYARVQDAWLQHDNCVRITTRTTDVAVFRSHFEAGSVPCVIKDATERWPAVRNWELRALLESSGDIEFDIAGMSIPLHDYLVYAFRVQNADDQSLILFDPRFAEKAPHLAADYTVPMYFRDDLFSLLGDARPDNRWLIIGPERSGSIFHKDPNCTSAWNAVITGKKKWLMFPPHAPPPGITPTADGSDVRGPVSVMEWFINFYDAAREYGRSVGAVECVVNAGEVMFVPAGWWHIVLNLEFTVAVTQNYASPVHAVRIAKWLRDRPEQISGCRTKKQALFMSKNFARLVASSRHEYVHSLTATGVLRPEDVPKNVPPEAHRPQYNRSGAPIQVPQASTDAPLSGEEASGEEFSGSDDVLYNADGTAAQVIRYDTVRASAVPTDSSSAEDVILPPVGEVSRSEERSTDSVGGSEMGDNLEEYPSTAQRKEGRDTYEKSADKSNVKQVGASAKAILQLNRKTHSIEKSKSEHPPKRNKIDGGLKANGNEDAEKTAKEGNVGSVVGDKAALIGKRTRQSESGTKQSDTATREPSDNTPSTLHDASSTSKSAPNPKKSEDKKFEEPVPKKAKTGLWVNLRTSNSAKAGDVKGKEQKSAEKAEKSFTFGFKGSSPD